MRRLGRTLRQRQPSAQKTIAQKVASILRKYGTDAHVYLPGIGVINGLTAGNYLDSAGTTAATVDNPVGLVVDGGGINAIQATTANKPILRRGAVNLLLQSETFQTTWFPTRSSISANAVNSPTGTLTADKLVEDTTASNSHVVTQNITTSAIAYTFSVYVKKGERTWVRLANASVANATAFFNLDTGALGTVGAAATALISNVGDGWYRCVITATATAAANTFSIAIGSADGIANYTGDGTSGIYIWGAQLETGSTASTYIPTTTAAASSATGNYHWVHDTTDVLTATFPAGYEAATTINASTAGQSTLTAQNIVGAYNIGPSIDTYGRFIFKTIDASELAIIQSFANRLAGV